MFYCILLFCALLWKKIILVIIIYFNDNYKKLKMNYYSIIIEDTLNIKMFLWVTLLRRFSLSLSTQSIFFFGPIGPLVLTMEDSDFMIIIYSTFIRDKKLRNLEINLIINDHLLYVSLCPCLSITLCKI